MPVFEAPPPATNFRAAIKTISPPWLADDVGYRVEYSIAIQLDALAEYLRLGVLQGFPTYCESEALPYQGLDARIQRGASEPESAFRERVRVAKTTWKRAGSPKSVLGQIAAYYSPSPPVIRYVSNGADDQGNSVADWWTLSGGTYSYARATPSNWNWDGAFGDFRFWIIVYTSLLQGWAWDDPGRYWNEPGLLWNYMNGQVIYDLLGIIRQWKAAGSHLGALIFAPATALVPIPWGSGFWGSGTWGSTYTANVFDPSGAPGYPLPNGDWQVPANRLPDAQYFFVPGD